MTIINTKYLPHLHRVSFDLLKGFSYFFLQDKDLRLPRSPPYMFYFESPIRLWVELEYPIQFIKFQIRFSTFLSNLLLFTLSVHSKQSLNSEKVTRLLSEFRSVWTFFPRYRTLTTLFGSSFSDPDL